MIVVSILASDAATLRARALSQQPFADTIELRLDALAHVNEAELRSVISALDQPVIAAVNGPDAFGTFTGTRAERFTVLERAAQSGAAFVDVDWREAPHQPPLPKSCRRIVSRHVLEGTPADLASAFAELTAATRDTDIPKLVAHAHSGEDGARLLEFARTLAGEFIIFASGERGSFTRVLAPIFGSQFTYAAPARIAGADSGSATAPGQLGADSLRALLPLRGLTRATEIFAVLGFPVRHSLSPRLHNAVFRANERDAVYVAIEPDDITAFLGSLSAPNWRGFSVTAPFKEPAYALTKNRDTFDACCSATNTLTRRPDGWDGSNTDVQALTAILDELDLGPLDHDGVARVLVIGSGGAARAAIEAACAGRRVTVSARNAEHAAQLAHDEGVAWLAREDLRAGDFDILVHCTPAGSRTAPNEIAVPLEIVRSARVVIEAVYRPLRTPLVEAAEAAGVEVVLGSKWFLEQAVGQALHFSPHGANAREVMRAELERALAEDGA